MKPPAFTPAIGAIAMIATVLSPGARADIVELDDGRRYEGEVLHQDESSVTLDTMVSASIRAPMRFDRDEIASIETKPLPAGFFDPPPAPERMSDPSSFSRDNTLFLEVPIRGRFGVDVFEEGLSAALRYARRHRIPHIVFTIDSEGVGLEEARAMYKTLGRNRNALTYHAIVTNCVGDALAVAVWCDTVHVQPGARLGGTDAPIVEGVDSDHEQLIRTQVAEEVAADMNKRGRQGDVVRAMIDPFITLAIWESADGEILSGDIPPPGIDPSRLVVNDGPDSVLVLTEAQTTRLGVPRFDGGADELGEALGLPGWSKESDYGAEAMARAIVDRRREDVQARVDHDDAVRRNLQQREVADDYIQRNVRMAAQWNPSEDTYETYSKRWRWGWGDGYRSGGNTWTQESRARWRNRTELTLKYLNEAARGVKTMIQLDNEAATLGLEPSYRPGELQWMLDDLTTKAEWLWANRNRMRN
jgi:hypothetical protein